MVSPSLASASNSGQSTHFHLTVPEATDRRVSPTTVQDNGSPLPRNRRARSSVSNAEASSTPLTETDILTEAPQAEDEGVTRDGNQDIVDSLDGQIQGHSAGQEDVTDGAIDSNLHSLANGDSIVRSESQATLREWRECRWHHRRSISQEMPMYDKVSARTYIKGSTGKVEQPRTGRTQATSSHGGEETLAGGALHQANGLECGPRQVGPTQEVRTMASVKSAGKGLKKRLSTIIRTRRASQVVTPATSSAVVENGNPTAVLDTAPELAPFAEELDVGEEFALVYSQMNNSSEDVASPGQLVDSAELVPTPEAETAVVLRLAAATPLPSVPTNGTEESSLAEYSNHLPSLPQGSANVEDESENIQPADVEVAAGDGASDPPPNENGNSGHADEQAPPAPVYSQLPSETHQEVFNRMQAALNLLLDAVHHETNPTVQTILYQMAEDLTNRIGTINDNSRAILYLQQAENNMVLAATLQQEHIERTLRDMGIQLNAGNN
ncbi:hypothetical protein DID88_009428 [Monilinia fructigena]|uniref:Uncharacterized protein n=1 Tax=Monilinia fructigena TaxID=38457 RepID=A0A395IT33_9HELO|nr:hypothetical protein DID88_009428 [Monilinia fructigena]